MDKRAITLHVFNAKQVGDLLHQGIHCLPVFAWRQRLSNAAHVAAVTFHPRYDHLLCFLATADDTADAAVVDQAVIEFDLFGRGSTMFVFGFESDRDCDSLADHRFSYDHTKPSDLIVRAFEETKFNPPSPEQLGGLSVESLELSDPAYAAWIAKQRELVPLR